MGEADAALAKVETLLKNLPFEIRRAESEYDALKRDYDGKASAKGVIAGIKIDIARSKSEAGKAAQKRFSQTQKRMDYMKVWRA